MNNCPKVVITLPWRQKMVAFRGIQKTVRRDVLQITPLPTKSTMKICLAAIIILCHMLEHPAPAGNRVCCQYISYNYMNNLKHQTFWVEEIVAKFDWIDSCDFTTWRFGVESWFVRSGEYTEHLSVFCIISI